MIKRIILEELEAFIEGTGDKYLQRSKGIPDAGEEFDNRYQAHLKSQESNPSMGELVKKFDSINYVEQGGKWVRIPIKVNVYKNPKSMDKFSTRVRAISDEQGDLYVADIMGDFTHYALGENIFGGNVYEIQKYVTWYWDQQDNAFSLASVSESAFYKLMKGDYSENFYDRFWNGIKKLKEKNPNYKFEEVDDKIADIKEGTGDRYAASKFGIPDTGKEFEDRWQQQVKTKGRDDQNGELITQLPGYEGGSNIYKNPKSLKRFDPDVRAISDVEGNLYVAQLDGNWYHRAITDALYDVGINLRDPYDVRENITWHRIWNTDDLALSISFMDAWNKVMADYATRMHYDAGPTTEQADMIRRMTEVNDKNPTLRLIPYYWTDISMKNVSPQEVDARAELVGK